MIVKFLKVFPLVLFITFFTLTCVLIAQDSDNQLIISQVSLNKKETNKSWLKILNPTENDLFLERFRLSHIKTINVLHKETSKNEGIRIPTGGSIILCTDEKTFTSLYGKRNNIINVNALSMAIEGGFLAIKTKGIEAAKGSIVRYGKRDLSSIIEQLAGSQVIGFSDDGKSYMRKIDKKESEIEVCEFIDSSDRP
ncbi:MAG: hypothetical protein IPH62_13260 [Ignavibacteriae bacterium]|nr:hypothetical protein [Ignavibacteriota bacterium]